MRFLADENIRSEVLSFLSSAGHDVLVVPSGAKNGQIAQIAKREKRIILTHDKHFADILMYPPQEYCGIIRIKIHPPSAPAVIQALKDFLPKVTPEQLDKKLVILERNGFRIR